MKNYSFEPFFKKGSQYINPHCKNTRRRVHDIVLWQLGYYNDKRLLRRPPRDFKYPNPHKKVKNENPTAMWINHCSFLVQIDGLHLLTDPIWSTRCSPIKRFGPRRRHPPPLSLKELPPIDIVLISHDHYDHLDRKTVKELNQCNPHTVWIVPLGVGKWMKKQGIQHVVQLGWWEKKELRVEGKPPLSLEVTSVPAQHFSGRNLFDKNQTLWSGYVIYFKRYKKKHKKLYFVGDTGYNRKDFKAIGKKFGKIDLSFIPIGTYIPSRFMDPVHIDPKKAAIIHREVGSKLSIGMHWKTFRLSSETQDQPPYDLYCALEKKNIDLSTFRVIDPGQTINW